MFKIDLVYLWCDGNDATFRKRKDGLKKSLNLNLPEDNAGDIRYVQNNELLYSLRSVSANLPWINHIYIVTDGQTPAWLKANNKISIVDHKEIIPNELLPTFNAYVIETYLHKIPNLSDHFIYANDDMFFLEKLTPYDFFDASGAPLVRLDKARKYTNTHLLGRESNNKIKTFLTSMQNAWRLFCKRNNMNIPFDTFDHSVSSYTKQSWEEILNKYPEITKLNVFPFRTYNEIHRLIFAYEMAYIKGSRLIYINRPSFLNRFLCRFLKLNIWVSCRQSLSKLDRDINICHPKTVCLNKVDDSNLFEKMFCNLYPVSAPWEK